MKTREIKELRTKTTNELLKTLKDARESLTTMKLEKAQNKLKNTRELFNLRNKIAVLLTILKEKELTKNA